MATEFEYYEIANKKGLTKEEADTLLSNFPENWTMDVLSQLYIELICDKFMLNNRIIREGNRLHLPSDEEEENEGENGNYSI
jgi:hypothetical protein